MDLALFFGALAAWVDGTWDRLDPEPPLRADSLERSGLPPLSSLLEDGRRGGRIRVYACSASVRLLGRDTATVQSRVDAILGWQSFSRRIRSADRTVTF